MTPAPKTPRSSVFRHDGAPCADAVPSKPIPMEGVTTAAAVSPSRNAKAAAAERSSAGSSKDTSRRQPETPIRDRIEGPLLPLKKRATCDGSGYSSHSDDSSLIPPKKRRMDYVDTGSKGVRSHHDAVVATAAPPKPSGSNAITAVTSEPPQEKLMHDAIRSGVRSDEQYHLHAPRPRRQRPGSRLLIMEEGEMSAEAAAAPEKKRTTTKKKDRAPVPVPVFPLEKARISVELSYLLDELGATEPRKVCEKRLRWSDVDTYQNRLLISCKREVLSKYPITWIFTEEETYHVHRKDKNGGLPVCAFDGRGRMFKIRLRYLDSNGGYRFIGEWGEFLRQNGLKLNGNSEWTRLVNVELCAFRSWELLPVLPEGEEDGNPDGVPRLPDHPDGALGLLLLPYEDRRNVDRGEEEGKRALPVHEAKMGHTGQASSSSPRGEEKGKCALPIHETKMGHTHTAGQASASAVHEEKLADAHAEQGEAVARDMTLDEMVLAIGEEMADPLIGLLMLTRSEEIEEKLDKKNNNGCLQNHCNTVPPVLALST